MPNSLKSKLHSLRYKRLLTDEEYQEIIKKLEGHDREIRNKAIDEFAKKLIMHFADWKLSEDNVQTKYIISVACEGVEEIAEQLKGGAE